MHRGLRGVLGKKIARLQIGLCGKVKKIDWVWYDLAESYPPWRQSWWVQYQIQFISRLGLELVGLEWLDWYSELTQLTWKKKTTNQQISYKRNPSQQESKFQRDQRFLYKRKLVKIWNKPMIISKAFKKSIGWRITYLILNPPLSECRFFHLWCVVGRKVVDRGCMVTMGRSNSLRGCRLCIIVFVVCWGKR